MRLTRLTLCSGQTGTFMMIVEQLGLAIRPLCLWICSGFTSGTTSGTPSFMRKALVLSTTNAPARTAGGADSSPAPPPRLHGGRRELLADRPARGKERDLHALEAVLRHLLDDVRPALELDGFP